MKHLKNFEINENADLGERIENAVDRANEAFWAAIAVEFPEMKTGDFSPEATIKFGNAQTEAVKTWLDSNKHS